VLGTFEQALLRKRKEGSGTEEKREGKRREEKRERRKIKLFEFPSIHPKGSIVQMMKRRESKEVK